MSAPQHVRSTIYYWKCDRPAAFHGTGGGARSTDFDDPLHAVLHDRFPGKRIELRPGSGQGNHVTTIATLDGDDFFVRIEDGPERDDGMEVDARILDEVRALGIPAPKVHAVDASRARVPFAWQMMDIVPCRDLNWHFKQGRLNLPKMAEQIGAAVARWQAVQPSGFGPFDPNILRRENRLAGFHARYEDYFFLQLDRHLQFLVERQFLPAQEAADMKQEILRQRDLLALSQGCLVHKDLALWNILGSETEIAAYIDWDDAISGDPMDDLSLLGCFYEGGILSRAIEGYASVRPLPSEHRRRFWLHLLRNMIVKAVIRVGAGYFDRADSFFLIGAGSDGSDLKTFTRERLAAALCGLRDNREIETL